MPEAEIIPLFAEGEIAARPSPLAQQAFDLWLEFSTKNKWKVPTDLDSGYRAALKRAIPDYGGLHMMRKILEMVERSDFYMGRVPPSGNYSKPFRPSLEWFLRPKTVRTLKEDLHNGGGDPPTVAPEVGRIAPAAINWRAVLDGYKGKGKSFWHHSFGPCPEEPGPHKAPAEMVEEWRRKNGVTGAAPQPTESIEERLRASIEGYRRIGRYEDANRIESKLAALLGRPAVHVPHPSVADVGMPEKSEPPAPTPPKRGRWSAEMLDVE